jgi:hypothetical protein
LAMESAAIGENGVLLPCLYPRSPLNVVQEYTGYHY